MLQFPRSLLAASVSAALFAPQLQANTSSDDNNNNSITPLNEQCLIENKSTDKNTEQPINVEADKLEAVNGDKATYSGNVIVVQGNKRISAEKVTMHQKENVVVAEGNVTFNDGQVKATSTKATNRLNDDKITLENTKYHFLCEPGRGDAVYVSKTGKAIYQIEDGSITSCPEGDDAWRMTASSIDIDKNEEEATFYNPRMEILNVPVFYLPMLTVPIGDTRKTGMLYPSFAFGSNNGFQTNIPIYWNLAPNYDLQTDIHYMEKRGTQLNSKFRYLTTLGSGSIDYEYLPDDDKYPEKGDRWGLQYQHSGIYHQNWKFGINYAKVSDVDYFTDVDSSIGTKQDGQLVQEGQVAYRAEDWDLSLLTRDFQILTSDGTQPYRLMPQLAFNYYAPGVVKHLDFDVKSHISRFETNDKDLPDATRVHIEPGIAIPLGASWGNWTTEARLLSTYYKQDLKDITGSDYKESVSRTIPEFRSHMGLVLENSESFLLGYTQTLEPQIQYLYVPKKDQSEIARYDTTILQTDYYGLFRSRKYGSVDYIAPANQVSYGATTRFFDNNYKERFNLSFGQIFYIDSAINPLNSSGANDSSDYSAWAIESDFNFNDYLFYHGGVQYDVDADQMQLANSSLELRQDDNFIQANYRYVSKEYIENTLGDSFAKNSISLDELTEDGISQVGAVGQYAINRHWKVNGDYYYDLTIDQAIEWQAGLTYLSDCWYIGFSYSKELNNWTNGFSQYPDSDPEYENNFGINFGIVGFGTNMSAGSSSNSSGTLGYGNPFFLNN
ncbi:LPS assembly protein LptD [Vibrio salinus]|uniref:LPS assembly protein LptD n=1 Tax=Vibrio salinus TaxID=2899784 RepID=UPI001E4CE845|nr:LPS assembly protein LptD [Vibrio salinus]MCE0494118.1 LPS assembly protein LptD [Vibrio salinus]